MVGRGFERTPAGCLLGHSSPFFSLCPSPFFFFPSVKNGAKAARSRASTSTEARREAVGEDHTPGPSPLSFPLFFGDDRLQARMLPGKKSPPGKAVFLSLFFSPPFLEKDVTGEKAFSERSREVVDVAAEDRLKRRLSLLLPSFLSPLPFPLRVIDEVSRGKKPCWRRKRSCPDQFMVPPFLPPFFFPHEIGNSGDQRYRRRDSNLKPVRDGAAPLLPSLLFLLPLLSFFSPLSGCRSRTGGMNDDMAHIDQGERGGRMRRTVSADRGISRIPDSFSTLK